MLYFGLSCHETCAFDIKNIERILKLDRRTSSRGIYSKKKRKPLVQPTGHPMLSYPQEQQQQIRDRDRERKGDREKKRGTEEEKKTYKRLKSLIRTTVNINRSANGANKYAQPQSRFVNYI